MDQPRTNEGSARASTVLLVRSDNSEVVGGHFATVSSIQPRTSEGYARASSGSQTETAN
jgi:hypothetical protein